MPKTYSQCGLGTLFARGFVEEPFDPATGVWRDAEPEPALSPEAWVHWSGGLFTPDARIVEARALDGKGRWQAERETPFSRWGGWPDAQKTL